MAWSAFGCVGMPLRLCVFAYVRDARDVSRDARQGEGGGERGKYKQGALLCAVGCVVRVRICRCTPKEEAGSVCAAGRP